MAGYNFGIDYKVETESETKDILNQVIATAKKYNVTISFFLYDYPPHKYWHVEIHGYFPELENCVLDIEQQLKFIAIAEETRNPKNFQIIKVSILDEIEKGIVDGLVLHKKQVSEFVDYMKSKGDIVHPSSIFISETLKEKISTNGSVRIKSAFETIKSVHLDYIKNNFKTKESVILLDQAVEDILKDKLSLTDGYFPQLLKLAKAQKIIDESTSEVFDSFHKYRVDVQHKGYQPKTSSIALSFLQVLIYTLDEMFKT